MKVVGFLSGLVLLSVTTAVCGYDIRTIPLAEDLDRHMRPEVDGMRIVFGQANDAQATPAPPETSKQGGLFDVGTDVLVGRGYDADELLTAVSLNWAPWGNQVGIAGDWAIMGGSEATTQQFLQVLDISADTIHTIEASAFDPRGSQDHHFIDVNATGDVVWQAWGTGGDNDMRLLHVDIDEDDDSVADEGPYLVEELIEGSGQFGSNPRISSYSDRAVFSMGTDNVTVYDLGDAKAYQVWYPEDTDNATGGFGAWRADQR